MTQNYANYTEISLNALKFNPKGQELIDRKQEILNAVTQYYGITPVNVLFYGFNPLILGLKNKQIAVTEVTEETRNYLDSAGVTYQYINESDLSQYKKHFSWTIAAEEYFTFANTEEEQQRKIESLASITKNAVLTTLRDYKNQDFKEREFSQPLSIHNRNNDSKLYLEYHNYDFNDKNSWKSTVYELQGNTARIYGPFQRRTMFFKQLAKFSIDAGAKQFYVHKNLMYKSLIRKNYEHVISLTF